MKCVSGSCVYRLGVRMICMRWGKGKKVCSGPALQRNVSLFAARAGGRRLVRASTGKLLPPWN
jgi:hypothetical protein